MPAIDESPASETVAMTPVEDIYNAALAEASKGISASPVAKEPAASAEPKKIEKAPASKPAPKSALDAALSPDEPVIDDTAHEPDADPLKDFPENAKDANWKKARELIGKQHGELKELRGKVGKSEPDPAILTELSTIKATLKEREAALAERDAKLAEYNDAMTALDLKNHPDFRKKFHVEREELVKSAAAKLKNYGGNPEAIVEALQMPEGKRRDAAIEEALEGLETESAKDKVRRYVSEIEARDEERDKALATPQQSYEELERKTILQRQKQAAEAEHVKTAEFARITRELYKKHPMLGPVDEALSDGKEWNADQKQDVEDAFKLFGPDAAFPDMVETALMGKRFNRVAKMLISERKETATLRAQLAQFDQAQPTIKGGKPPAKNASEAALEKDPGQVYADAMAKLGTGVDDD